MRLAPLRWLASLLCIGFASCTSSEGGGETRNGGGTLVVTVPAEPSTLFPPLVTGVQGMPIIGVIFDRLAEIGDALETFGDRGFTPRLATAWRWAPDSLSIAFTVDSTARWHDGQPVTAEDVRYTFRVYTSDSLAVDVKSLLGNIDSVSVGDPRTATFWFKRRMPRQFYDATYHMFVLPSHLLDTIAMAKLESAAFGRAPVGSGRFRFVRWDPGQRIEVLADTANFRGSAQLDRVIWSIAPDFSASTMRLTAGDADFLEMLRPENLTEIARVPSLRILENRALGYSFLGFNLRDPANRSRPNVLFADVRVRRALTMAVDRERLVRNVFDSLGMVGLGPAPRALIPDTTAFTPLPYNVAAAGALLDSAGWRDHDGDGIRDRNGIPLAFSIHIPSSSVSRQRYGVLLQEQFRLIGVKATPLTLENNAWSNAVYERFAFDTYLGGWQTSPGLVGVRQVWTSRGSGNAGLYENAVFDAHVDSALATFDPTASRRSWARVFQQIHDDAPAIWLYEQRTMAAISHRFVTTPLRADAWYAGLADWRVDPALRIDRDRIGRGTPP